MERIAVYLASLDTSKTKRDNALLQVGYFGEFRRSEIATLEVAHVFMASGEITSRSLFIHVGLYAIVLRVAASTLQAIHI